MGLCGSSATTTDPALQLMQASAADAYALPARRNIDAAARLGTGKFAGLGDADYQAAYTDQMAQAMLAQQQQFGPAYVQQRLEELKRSDPEGYAIRKNLFDTISADLNGPSPDRPAAQSLQDAIMADLEQGGGMDDATLREVQQGARAKQVILGNFLGNAPVNAEARAVGQASENLQADRQAAALQFLTTGVSPDDVQDRRRQQSLGNLGSFINGSPITAQFGQVSGAQNGVVPFQGGGPSVGLNQNAGFQGAQYGQQIQGATNNWQNSQINPWISGIGQSAQFAGSAAALGAFQKGPSWSNTGAGNTGYFSLA